MPEEMTEASMQWKGGGGICTEFVPIQVAQK
jgi:hypothetical protein